LYNILRIELAQSIGRLSQDLTDFTETETKWIIYFNKVLKWFDDQIVSFKSQYRVNVKSQNWIVLELASISLDLSRPSLCPSFERCLAHSVRFSDFCLENDTFC
jgi:hypothetical protein